MLELEAFGQSICIDFIRREMTTSGELERSVYEDGVSGVTSNPSVFEKAIAESHDYDEGVGELSLARKTANEKYQRLTIKDMQMVVDLIRTTMTEDIAPSHSLSLGCFGHNDLVVIGKDSDTMYLREKIKQERQLCPLQKFCDRM